MTGRIGALFLIACNFLLLGGIGILNHMKNILVAGGTDGIGLAFVRRLELEKYQKVFILGRNFKQVAELKLPNAIELPCDITNNDSLVDTIGKIDQPLDEFVNTIGTFYKSPTEKMDPSDIARHFEVNAVGNINLTNAVLSKLNAAYAQILACSATLALEAREHYALQSATKAAYRYYLETLRKEKKDTLKVMALYPSSVNTSIFKKSGDMRNTLVYPSPDAIADIMYFMLAQPRQIYIPEIRVDNFS